MICKDFFYLHFFNHGNHRTLKTQIIKKYFFNKVEITE